MLKKIFIVFMSLFPLFSLKILYNSYITLFITIFVYISLIYMLFKDREAKKSFKYLLIYFSLIGIYSLFHHLNALNFNSLAPIDYSWFKECLYILKLSVPLIFIYIVYYLKIEKETYFKIAKIWLIIISGSIILTNLFNISLGSYSDIRILGNIFYWFSDKYTYYDLASKGYFMYANQISAILVCLIPLIFYMFIKNKLKIYYLIILMISLLMLGTRVANIGGVLILFGTLSAYLFFCLLKKNIFHFKKVLLTLVIIIGYSLILPFSPTINRHKIYDYILDDKIELVYNDQISFDSHEYIKNNYQDKKIKEHFIINSYPYQYDPEFWLAIMELEEEKRINYRFLEISMIERIVEINNNPADIFFGMTNNRIQNVFNIERDFILQYYAFGIIGCLLFIFVYGITIVYSLIKLIKNFTFFNSLFALTSMLIVFIAYLSGNIMNHLSINLILLFITSFYYNEHLD